MPGARFPHVLKQHHPITFHIGVREFHYGICCPWVRQGWGLDGLGKFLRSSSAAVVAAGAQPSTHLAQVGTQYQASINVLPAY